MLLMIYGDDAFRVTEKARSLVHAFVQKHDPTKLNVDEILFTKKDDVDQSVVADAIHAMPFLSQKRLVRIDGMLSCVTTKPEAAGWVNLFSSVPDSTIVLFVDRVSPEKVAKIELAKQLLAFDGMISYPFPALSGSDLRCWVIERAHVHGAVLVPAVAEALLAHVGADTWRLDTEIAKLAAYAGDAPVTAAMIEILVGREYRDDMFGFIDAITAGRSEYALQKLFAERSAGADNFPLFGMLVRQIRLMLQVRSLYDDIPSIGKQDVASRLGLHPFVAQKLLAEVSKKSRKSLEFLHSRAVDLDAAMKRGLDSGVAVDRLVALLLDGK